jgi:ammonia channel protein AmtB
VVAGLGTITPASGYVGPMGGLVIGLVAGVVCFFATQLKLVNWLLPLRVTPEQENEGLDLGASRGARLEPLSLTRLLGAGRAGT